MKMRHRDREYRAEEEDFSATDEGWNEYILPGTGEKVRVRLVVRKIYRALNEDGSLAFNEQGEPLVWVSWGDPIIAASPGTQNKGVQ